jgi:histone deacetylase 1/2
MTEEQKNQQTVDAHQQKMDAQWDKFDSMGGNNTNRKMRVSYYYDDEFSIYQLGTQHVMKPFRIKMTDALVQAYDLYDKMRIMDVDEEYIASVDLTTFHSDDYVDCLANVSTDIDV